MRPPSRWICKSLYFLFTSAERSTSAEHIQTSRTIERRWNTNQHATPFSFVFQLSGNVFYVIINRNSSMLHDIRHYSVVAVYDPFSTFFSFFAAKILSIYVFCIFLFTSSSSSVYIRYVSPSGNAAIAHPIACS